MPPTGRTSEYDFSNLTDAELSTMLKDYGVNVGPVNEATRRTYERRLIKLKTGEIPPTLHHFEPVIDESEEEDEVQIKPEIKKPSQPVRELPRPSYSGREVNFSFSDVRSRPSLNDSRTTSSLHTSYSPSAGRSPSAKPSQSGSSSIPSWVKLVVLAVALVLVYLIYINMEPQAVSNIPKIQSSLEV